LRNEFEKKKAVENDELNAWKNKAVKVITFALVSHKSMRRIEFSMKSLPKIKQKILQGQLVLFFGRPTLQSQLMKKKVT
jgi:hypothetical protein